MNPYLLIFLFFFYSLTTQAQSADTILFKELYEKAVKEYKKGNYEKSLSHAKERLSLMRQRGEEGRSYANALNDVGLNYFAMGRYEEAESFFQEVLELRQVIYGEEHLQYASSLNNLATLYQSLKRFKEAESFSLQTMELRRKLLGEKHTRYATSLLNLGVLYIELNQLSKAERLLLEAISILAETEGKRDMRYGVALNNLAAVYDDQRAFEKAERVYNEAKAIRKAVGDWQGYAATLHNIAGLYDRRGEVDKAVKTFERSLDIREKYSKRFNPSYLNSLGTLASLYGTRNQFEKADSLFWKGLKINTNGRYSKGYYDAAAIDALSSTPLVSTYFCISQLNGLSELRLSQYGVKGEKKLLKEAFHFSKVALVLSEQLRNEFSARGDKLKLLKQTSNWVAHGLKVVRLLEPEAGPFSEEAFVFIEQNKSVILADALKARRARTFGYLPDSLAIREEILLRSARQLDEKRLALDEDTSATFSAKINALNLEVNKLQKFIKQQYPKYYKQKYASITAQAKDVQALLDESTAFLEYFIEDSTVYLFCLKAESMQVYTRDISKDSLGRQVGRLRRALSDYDLIQNQADSAFILYTRTAEWFYRELLAPALQSSQKIEHLIIIADGELGHLPFEVFLTREIKKKQSYAHLPYLLRDYRISYNYSATLFSENREQPAHTENGRLLAMAGSYANQQRNPLRQRLQELPAAREEILALEKLVEGRFLLDSLATEEQFKALARGFGIIHLALHGLLNQRRPVLSGLVFQDSEGDVENNFLQAFEISKMDLKAALVVLSACETGYGKFQQGEGIMSLARAFMYAGVPSLVVSLWQVNDISTASIIPKFYENLADGMNKAEALQAAKLYYLRTAQHTHPAYWAPFVQVGDSRPIALESKSQFSWWWVAAVLCLVGGLLLLGKVLRQGKL